MSNREKKTLEDLNLSQLHILLKHLQLGSDHLKLLLSPQQLKELYQVCPLSEEQLEQISATKVETLGNMSLTINTIITSTFGAWMGLSGCIGLGLGSYKILGTISSIAFFVSGFIGYMSLNSTRNQAYQALDNQSIHQLQLHILKLINEKTVEKTKSAAFYLQTATFLLEDDRNTSHTQEEVKDNHLLFTNLNDAYEWYEKLSDVLKNRLEKLSQSSVYDFYEQQISRMTYSIKRIISKHVRFLEHLASTEKKQQKSIQYLQTLPFIKIMTNPSFGVPQHRSIVPKSWIKGNLRQLILGLMPTVWGGFASMFVFVGGIPNITRELGFKATADFLSQPTARVFEISMAICITLYFAFSFLYSSRKIWQRTRLLEETEKQIANEETYLLTNTHLLTMLFKLKIHMQKLVSLFNIARKTDQELVVDHVPNAFFVEELNLPTIPETQLN